MLFRSGLFLICTGEISGGILCLIIFISLAYWIRKKNNPKSITTRLPAFTLSLDAGIFTQSVPCEVLLEAQDAKGNVVGEPRISTDLNPTTRTIALTHGESKQIVLKMDTDFEGKFTVKAMNPVTLTAYAKLELTTDYTV